MRWTVGRAGHHGTARARRTWMSAIAATALLAACATPDSGRPREPSSAGAAPTFWSGRFAAVYTIPGAQAEEQSAAGRFRLETSQDNIRLELIAPTGQTIAQARVDARGAQLTDNRGKLYEAASAEALTERLFGWRIPVQALPQWLQGRVESPGASAEGRLREGNDSGWSVRFDAWRADGLVRSLELQWPLPGQLADRRIRLRLIVDEAS